jgi:murein L,D-transpeptidase YcbB/YkuD
LFNEETRAFSHGCIRVAKPKELAYALLEDDPKWTKEKIDAAMNKGKETWYNLDRKVPVYIGYFTSWVDQNGVVHFYKDVYSRDDRLAEVLAQE